VLGVLLACSWFQSQAKACCVTTLPSAKAANNVIVFIGCILLKVEGRLRSSTYANLAASGKRAVARRKLLRSSSTGERNNRGQVEELFLNIKSERLLLVYKPQRPRYRGRSFD
jgi:hypothetical protein